MSRFKGQAQYSVDNKGRVAIPAKMRGALHPDAAGTFVMTRGFEKCIYLYPLDEWQRKEAEYSALNTHDREARHFIRQFLRWADEVSLDAQGRLALAKPLIEYAGLSDRGLIIGAMERIEIWDPATLAEHELQQENDQEVLAESVLGSLRRDL